MLGRKRDREEHGDGDGEEEAGGSGGSAAGRDRSREESPPVISSALGLWGVTAQFLGVTLGRSVLP